MIVCSCNVSVSEFKAKEADEDILALEAILLCKSTKNENILWSQR
jgi:hypothetical protein